MKTTRVICWLGVALSIACAAELFEYLAENQDNHTSFEPWLLSAVFAPTAVVGMIHLIRTRRLALPAVLAMPSASSAWRRCTTSITRIGCCSTSAGWRAACPHVCDGGATCRSEILHRPAIRQLRRHDR